MYTHFLLLTTPFPSPSLTLTLKSKPPRRPPFSPLCTATNGGADGPDRPSPPPPPPDAVEIRFRRGSARRRKQQKLNQSSVNGDSTMSAQKKTQTPAKKWEEMTLSEKALELYLGEKGALFWLNKFAYASIFIVIGGWILFRFVGPSLNLYQLDSPPLAPDAIFKK